MQSTPDQKGVARPDVKISLRGMDHFFAAEDDHEKMAGGVHLLFAQFFARPEYNS